jgi:hypothetical protein
MAQLVRLPERGGRDTFCASRARAPYPRTVSANSRWALGIALFTIAFGLFVAFDGPISVVGALTAVCGGVVFGFAVGSLLRNVLNPANPRPHPWHGIAVALAVFVGLLLGRTLNGGGGGAAIASAIGGLVAAMAYFSPKLRAGPR